MPTMTTRLTITVQKTPFGVFQALIGQGVFPLEFLLNIYSASLSLVEPPVSFHCTARL